MKGIILAGGKATRLYPITRGVCKQMLPIYDKPMIYYPLSVLMLAGIKDILIISTKQDVPRFKDLLGNGSSLGIKFTYSVQDKPGGIAQSFILGKRFIGKDTVCLILGDNLIYGENLSKLVQSSASLTHGSVIYAYRVKDPERYGVIDFNDVREVVSITEKPNRPSSNWVVSGLYFFDNEVVKIASKISPSSRGELEITAVLNEYINRSQLSVKYMGRGFAWLDTGTFGSLIDASTFIKTIEERQCLKIGCIEEVAYNMGYINKIQLEQLANNIHTEYGEYLRSILNE